MAFIKPYNILISGVGGQGVLGLTGVVWKLCEMNKIRGQGSTFKGGAQRLGSIYSVLRLFLTGCPDYSLYSCQVPEGEVDLVIGLEPWETLRYHAYFGKQTRIIMNTNAATLFEERYTRISLSDPVRAVKNLGLPVVSADYTARAIEHFHSQKMVNYFMGLDALTANGLPFTKKDYVKAFVSRIRVGPAIEEILRRDA